MSWWGEGWEAEMTQQASVWKAASQHTSSIMRPHNVKVQCGKASSHLSLQVTFLSYRNMLQCVVCVWTCSSLELVLSSCDMLCVKFVSHVVVHFPWKLTKNTAGWFYLRIKCFFHISSWFVFVFRVKQAKFTFDFAVFNICGCVQEPQASFLHIVSQ